MVNNSFDEPFCPSVGKRPWMYLNRNICGMYDCIYEMIGVLAKMSKKRLNVHLIKSGGLIEGISINSDAEFIDAEKKASLKWDWLNNLTYFNAMYIGGRRFNFNHMHRGGPIIMASKFFSIASGGTKHTVQWMSGVERQPILKFSPTYRSIKVDNLSTVGTEIVWKPDFNMFEYFDGKIVVGMDDSLGPRCRFEDEDFSKAWSRRFESGVYTETIDHNVVKDIMSACWVDPEINVNDVIMVMT